MGIDRWLCLDTDLRVLDVVLDTPADPVMIDLAGRFGQRHAHRGGPENLLLVHHVLRVVYLRLD